MKKSYKLKNNNYFSGIEVGKRLRGLRGKEKQADYADRIGSSQGMVSRYESGKDDIPHELLIQIAKLHEVSIDWILTGHEKATEAAEGSARYGHFPMDMFWLELGREIEDLKPSRDREVLRQHLFMILRPHLKSIDQIWKRHKDIREELDKK